MVSLLKEMTARLASWAQWVHDVSGRTATEILSQIPTKQGGERWQLAVSLKTVPLRDAHVRRLIELMDLPDAHLRWILEDVLTALGAKRVRPLCEARLQREGNVGSLVGCIRVLSTLKVHEALPSILAWAHHPDVAVRVAVAHGLDAFLSDERAQEALLTLLDDDALAVQRAATWSLRRSGIPWAAALLATRARNASAPWFAGVGRTEEPSSLPYERVDDVEVG